jgi:hypothetical protein
LPAFGRNRLTARYWSHRLEAVVCHFLHYTKLIVQSWRSVNFAEDDPDSTLILAFVPEGGNGRIDLIHIDVPEQDFQGVSEGWEKYYWTPWKRYLTQK